MFYAVVMPPYGFLGMPRRYKSSLHFNWYKGLITRDMLERAEKIRLSNALRGVFEADLVY